MQKRAPLSLSERLDPKSTALIVVDVQNDFCHPDGICAKSGDDISSTGPMVENIKQLTDAARKAGLFIVFIRTSYDQPVLSPPTSESQFARRGFSGICLEGTHGIEFVDGIGPLPGAPNEVVVDKHRPSAFWYTRLDLVLRSNGIKTLVMSGFATDVCVESTLRDGFFKDYHIVEAAECVSSFHPTHHEASQTVVAKYFGPVLPMKEITAVWAAAQGNERNWQPAVKSAGMLRTLERQVAPEHTALVLIDIQNDFCDERGIFPRRGGGMEMVKAALPRMRELLAEGRKSGALVIHIQAQYGLKVRNVGAPHRYPSGNEDGLSSCLAGGDFDTYEDSFDDPGCEPCLPGTWGEGFVQGFEPVAGEVVIRKHRYSAFVDTKLETVLRSNGIKTVVLMGVTTNCCVESTARDAAMRDFYVVVASDCVATKDSHADLHDGTLRSLEAYFAQVVPGVDIAAAWAGAAVPLRLSA